MTRWCNVCLQVLDDWRYIAMVIDRLQLYVFLAVTFRTRVGEMTSFRRTSHDFAFFCGPNQRPSISDMLLPRNLHFHCHLYLDFQWVPDFVLRSTLSRAKDPQFLFVVVRSTACRIFWFYFSVRGSVFVVAVLRSSLPWPSAELWAFWSTRRTSSSTSTRKRSESASSTAKTASCEPDSILLAYAARFTEIIKSNLRTAILAPIEMAREKLWKS